MGTSETAHKLEPKTAPLKKAQELKPEPEPLKDPAPTPVVTPKAEPIPEPAATPAPVETVAEPDAKPATEHVAVATPMPVGKKPKIAIVMDDLGLDIPRTARTVKLPAPLTLSFMSYAGSLDKQTQKARKGGHELWLHIPMEPSSPDVDPGPNVLLTGIPEQELLTSLK